MKDLIAYETVNPEIAKVAANKFCSHLWYLSEELVCLCLFDDNVSAKDKADVVKAIQDSPPSDEEPLKKPHVDLKTIRDCQLSTFASRRSSSLFEMLKLPVTEDPISWNTSEDYQLAKCTVNALTVVNNHAERGVALVQEFSGLMTKDEHQLQFALQVINVHRKRYPDQLKRTLTLQ